MSAAESQSSPTTTSPLFRPRCVAIGFARIVLATGLLFLCGDSSMEFWRANVLYAAFTIAMAQFFLLPAYLICFGITILIIRRLKLSVAARRRWVLGPSVLFLVWIILILINSARPNVAIRWITHGKPFKSIQSVHAAHVSTMMSDRAIAWFQIAPEELHSLIAQHQLVVTNVVNFHGILRSDFLIGGTSIPDRIPPFLEPVCYARTGSDEFQHYFSVFVLTNTNHDEAVWYTTYDR